MKARGLYVSPNEFVSFGENKGVKSLGKEIATRQRRPDFNAMGAVLPNPDPVLKKMGKDIQVYRDLRSEPQVGGNIRRRKGAVKALEWGINQTQASKQAHGLITGLFDDYDFSRILSEILDATLYGYQPLEVRWGKVGSYLVPVDIVGKPAEWFHFDNDNLLRLKTKDEPRDGELLPPYKFLLPRQDASYDNPYGFPDLSMVFWATAFKKGGLSFWVQFSERYGSPWLVGKHPRNTPVHETESFLGQLEEMIQDAVAVIPDDSSVNIVESASKGASADIFERLLMFCRSEVNIALLGQNQSTEATSTRASAEAGLQVTRDIRDADKGLVEATLNTLIRWVCNLNFTDAATPRFEMWEQREVDEVMAKRDESLTKAGARLTPQYFTRAYGLQDGDLDETPVNNNSVDPAFAEGEAFPDQQALDEIVAGLSADQLDAEARAILQPLLDSLLAADSEEDALKLLETAYPRLDSSVMEERLAQLLFAADLVGRASVQAEIQNEAV